MVQTCGMDMSTNARCDAAYVSFHAVPITARGDSELSSFFEDSYMAYHKKSDKVVDRTVVLTPLVFFEAKYEKINAFPQLCMAMFSAAQQLKALGVKKIYLLGVSITAKTSEINLFALIWEKVCILLCLRCYFSDSAM